MRKTIYGQNAEQLKLRLRVAMGWPDRRSWRPEEWDAIRAAYDIRLDFRRGLMVARPVKPANTEETAEC